MCVCVCVCVCEEGGRNLGRVNVLSLLLSPGLAGALFCSFCFCLYGPFNCILFHKIFRHLSAISLCSSGLIFALLVLSTIYISL